MKDFGPSWRDGVAFQSVVHAIRPDLVDMEVVRRRSNRENLEEAFSLAENELGIPRLLDPEGDLLSCTHSSCYQLQNIHISLIWSSHPSPLKVLVCRYAT